MLIPKKFYPKKHLGQHFLKNKDVCNEILAHIGLTNEDIILEIGPGFGALTFPASKLVSKVFAIEKDLDLVKILKKQLLSSNISNVELMGSDIMDVNLNSIYKLVGNPLILIGNLPYNISSKILIKTIQNKNIFNKAVFMLQEEVANRICSAPGSKNYGRLSVILQYHAKIKHLLTVEPEMFFPKPKIKSSVIEITFLKKPILETLNENVFFSVVKAAFSKRRKILKNSLSKEFLKLDDYEILLLLNRANIDPKRRAETLSIEEFVTLSNFFNKYINDQESLGISN